MLQLSNCIDISHTQSTLPMRVDLYGEVYTNKSQSRQHVYMDFLVVALLFILKVTTYISYMVWKTNRNYIQLHVPANVYQLGHNS